MDSFNTKLGRIEVGIDNTLPLNDGTKFRLAMSNKEII